MTVQRIPLVRTLIALAVLAATASAQATDLYTGTLTLTANSPAQLGRLSRSTVGSGVPSDWSGPKAFPGVANTTTSYAYTTLTLDLPALAASLGFAYAPYIQISIDSASVNTFLSGYANVYDPANLATNYLGDAGNSGNIFPGDPRFFQLVVPGTQKLVLVLNETSGSGLGLNQPASILVEAFRDTAYTNLSPVPEPAPAVMLALGIAALAAMRRKASASVAA